MTKNPPSNIKTWGQALDYTTKYRWKHLASAKTACINSNHITNYGGRSLPLDRMGKSRWWMELIADLKSEGRASNTILHIISAGTTVLRYTKLAELHNISVPDFDRPKAGEHRLTWYSKEEVAQLAFAAIDVFDRKDLADAIVFSAFTGVRQGELLKLKSADYDPTHDQIWVGGKKHLITKPKNVRALAINPKIKDIVMDRLDRDFLFKEDWTNKDQLYAAFVKVRDYCGFDSDYCWHSLRHSFGTWMGEVAHPRQVMEALGHSTIDMSLKYCKATDKAVRGAVLAL